MTLAEMILYARELADAIDDPKYEDSEIKRFINRGIADVNKFLVVQNGTPILRKTTATIAPDTTSATLTELGIPSAITIHEIYYSDSHQTIPHIHPEQENSSKYMTAWYKTGVTVHFTKSFHKETPIDIWYFASMARLTEDTDEVSEVPDIYHDVFVLYAVARMAEKDKSQMFVTWQRNYFEMRNDLLDYLMRENPAVRRY